MAITQEQVFQVADDLVGRNEKPTLVNVRRALGGGSFSTISEAMAAWRSARAAVVEPLREPAPQVITDRLTALGAELWAVAQEMATARLTTEREALESARVELESARVEATELADQLSAELEAAQATCAELESAVEASRQDALTLHDQVVAHQERTTAAEGRAADLSAALAAAEGQRQADARRIEDLLQELATVKEQNRAHQERQKNDSAELTRAGQRLQAFEDRLNDLSGKVIQANSEAQRHDEGRRRAEDAAEALRASLAEQQQHAQALAAELATAKESSALLRGEAEALRRHISEQLASPQTTKPVRKPTQKNDQKTPNSTIKRVKKQLPNGA